MDDLTVLGIMFGVAISLIAVLVVSEFITVHRVGMQQSVCMTVTDQRGGTTWTADKCMKSERLLELLRQE